MTDEPACNKAELNHEGKPGKVKMNSHLVCRARGGGKLFDQHSVREMQFGSKETFRYVDCINVSMR